MEKENDVQLIRRILSGDDVAFSILVEKYQKSVHALAWRKISDFHHAEEITQDTFLQVYKKLSTLRNPNQFAGWLYVIANRRCLNWLRKQKTTMQSLEDTSVKEMEKAAYTRYVSEERETAATQHRYEIVEKLLARLPESERTVMTLYYLGEMTTKEISKFLGVSVKTISSRLLRARKRLQEKEEFLVQEVLGGVQLSVNLTENIMQQVADLKLTPPSATKPLLPWGALGAAAILILLLIGVSNQHLARFQQPYSFEAESEPTIEIVDAPTLLETDAKPALRNQVGRAIATTGKTSSNGLQVAERVSTSNAPVHLEDAEAWMPDPALREAVREEIGLLLGIPLTKEKMLSLEHLDASHTGIFDIMGLEFATNLRELYLGLNPITDLRPLANLTTLESLHLWKLAPNTPTLDLRPLANLINLEVLSLGNSRISDISPLAGLKKLRVLQLLHNHISDIRPLAGLTELRTLSIEGNPITDFTPLVGTHLRELDLSNNPITDLRPLETLINLEKLSLENTTVSDISLLAGLKGLRSLDLSHNHISDIRPLARLTELRTLLLKENPITDLTLLAGLNLTDLKYDVVGQPTRQTDLAEAWMPDRALRAAVPGEIGLLPGVPLTKEKMQGVGYINVAGKGISDITGLEFATNLRELDLSQNPITDLHPLANLTTLERLYLSDVSPNTPTLDLRPLVTLINLKELSLKNSKVSDISLLARLTELRSLDLSHNHISDIRPLSDLRELRTLRIRGNPIKNLMPLSGLNLTNLKYDIVGQPTGQTDPAETWMPDATLRAAVRGEIGLLPGTPLTKQKMLSLGRLAANHTGIFDITGLEFATNLRELHLGQNPITDLRPLANLTTLESLHLWKLSPNTPTLDLHPLANLINLEVLSLGNSRISDISPLAGLKKLRVLQLLHNHISDIRPLAGLAELWTLSIEGNPITDLTPLAGTHLRELDLSNNLITDLRPLETLINLEKLSLENTKVSDISLLAGLKELRSLDLSDNHISDIRPLSGLRELRTLLLKGNPIRDFTPLSGLNLTNLKYDEQPLNWDSQEIVD